MFHPLWRWGKFFRKFEFQQRAYIMKKQQLQNLELSPAANYRWRFMGSFIRIELGIKTDNYNISTENDMSRII